MEEFFLYAKVVIGKENNKALSLYRISADWNTITDERARELLSELTAYARQRTGATAEEPCESEFISYTEFKSLAGPMAFLP